MRKTHCCLLLCFCLSVFLTQADGGLLKEGEGHGITWTSSLDRKIQNLPGDGKEKYSVKRLKHLHQEKVLAEMQNSKFRCISLRFCAGPTDLT